ncbi:hypothetical protein ACU8LZ_25670 (plasmid) [Rhizobium leguminosarum]
MYDPNPTAAANRFLHHWMTTERLSRFGDRGVLNPNWRHWIYERGGIVKGISTAAWTPREEEDAAAEAFKTRWALESIAWSVCFATTATGGLAGGVNDRNGEQCCRPQT